MGPPTKPPAGDHGGLGRKFASTKRTLPVSTYLALKAGQTSAFTGRSGAGDRRWYPAR